MAFWACAGKTQYGARKSSPLERMAFSTSSDREPRNLKSRYTIFGIICICRYVSMEIRRTEVEIKLDLRSRSNILLRAGLYTHISTEPRLPCVVLSLGIDQEESAPSRDKANRTSLGDKSHQMP